MSMLGSILRDVRSLLFAEECIACGMHVTEEMHGICPMCRYNIPLTHFWLHDDNPVKELLSVHAPIHLASSLFYFSGGSIWQALIHRFKYGNAWQIAYSMGLWYGAELRDTGRYDDVDMVIAVPLHPIKRLKRGYNQSSYIADGIAKSLGCSVERKAARRIRNNPSQARRSVDERWKNTDNLFRIVRPERLQGKHILLVDDVLTSGATMTALISAIRESVPDCTISVATLAVTRYISEIR